MIWPFRREARAPRPDAELRAMGADFVTQQNFFDIIGLQAHAQGIPGVSVTVDSALSVPAIGAAVNFLSGTLAGLPLSVYRQTDGGRERETGPLSAILGNAVNDTTSSFAWRKYTFEQILTRGRAFTYIERANGAVQNLWPLNPASVTVERRGGRRRYVYAEGARLTVYDEAEIIDLAWMMREDNLQHRGPIAINVDVVALAIAATRYGSRLFANGGVPPFILSGAFQGGGAMDRASADVTRAVKKALDEGRLAMALPAELKLEALGIDPEKMQMVELKRFLVEEVARIYGLPPTFLQDLTHGTYSNTEQQDLHVTKHTLRRWIEQFEQEVNLKLFGREAPGLYVELGVDGLLRGDFKTRTEGYRGAIQSGWLTPDEVRDRENLPPIPGGDQAFIQGANVPLTMAGQHLRPSNDVPTNGDGNAT